MIRSFLHRGLADLFKSGNSADIAAALQKRCLNKLTVLNKAKDVREVTGPGFGTHPLKDTNPQRYSMSVSGAWRITFEFTEGDAYRVNLEQYH